MLGYDAILSLDEYDKKFNDILQEIAIGKEQNRLRQDMKDEFARVWDEITKLRNTVFVIGARWGIMAEDAFREGIKECWS